MKKPAMSFTVAVMLLAFCGLFTSFLLMQEHYLGKTYRAEGRDTFFSGVTGFACGDQSSYFSCEDVDASEYSTLFGFPLSAWGIMYFIILVSVAAFLAFASESLTTLFAMLMFLLAR